MGHLSLTAGLAQKAYSAGFKIVGGLPGGLGMASSLGCGLFAAATGSSAATAATLGKVAVPEMEKYGYLTKKLEKEQKKNRTNMREMAISNTKLEEER